MPAPVLGVSVVAVRDGAVLLVRRAEPPLAGWWALPGGKVRFGETLAAAAAREVFEETGIWVSNLEQVDLAELIEQDADGTARTHHLVIVFLGVADGATPFAGDDAAEALWIPLADAAALQLTADTRRVLAGVRSASR